MNTKTYDPVPSRRVAFLGLGVMGFPMAGHLRAKGHEVTVYNRTGGGFEERMRGALVDTIGRIKGASETIGAAKILASGKGLDADPVEAVKWHLLATDGGRADAWLDDFMKQLAQGFTPNTSALFVLVRKVTADKVLEDIRGSGGKILQSSLSHADELRLQEALDAGRKF